MTIVLLTALQERTYHIPSSSSVYSLYNPTISDTCIKNKYSKNTCMIAKFQSIIGKKNGEKKIIKEKTYTCTSMYSKFEIEVLRGTDSIKEISYICTSFSQRFCIRVWHISSKTLKPLVLHTTVSFCSNSANLTANVSCITLPSVCLYCETMVLIYGIL